MKWQPIIEFPFDKPPEQFIVYDTASEAGYYDQVRYDPKRERFEYWGVDGFESWGFVKCDYQPTHFMVMEFPKHSI